MYLGGFVEDLALAGLELKMGVFCSNICGRKMSAKKKKKERCLHGESGELKSRTTINFELWLSGPPFPSL